MLPMSVPEKRQSKSGKEASLPLTTYHFFQLIIFFAFFIPFFTCLVAAFLTAFVFLFT